MKIDLTTTYITIKILYQMKLKLGIEACLEYIDNFISVIGKDQHKLNKTVDHMLQLIDVDVIYQELMNKKCMKDDAIPKK